MPVNTPHTDYLATASTWYDLRSAYQGSGAVKTAADLFPATRGVKDAGTRYLPRPLGMRREAQYQAYKARAIWYGATERVVHGLAGAVFRREPQVEVPDTLLPQLADVTQTGVPLRSFAEEVVRETLLMGRCGVLVDFPPPEDAGRLPRPYWVTYRAEDILNWRTTRQQGTTVLNLVVLKEYVPEPQGVYPSPDFFVTKDRVQYRVLRLTDAGQYEVSVWQEIPASATTATPVVTQVAGWMPRREGVPLDYIPFTFLAPFSLEPPVEKSLLEALVEVNFQYYRHSADYEHGLHLTALPTAYIAANMDAPPTLTIGSAEAWFIPDNQANVGMLEFHGQGLQSHERALENDIKNMASLGARLLEGAPLVQETATAVRSRTQGTESPLQSLVTTVSHGLTQALQTHAWWAGVTENVDDETIHVTLNTDLLSLTLDAPLLTSLMQLFLNGTISYETLYYNLQRGDIARPQVPVDEEQALLEVRALALPLALPSGRNGTGA